MVFTDDVPSHKEYIKWIKSKYLVYWRITLSRGLNSKETMTLSDEEYEKLYFDRWFHVKKKDK
jgi:hypothetical protein